ncbi:MAG: C40 family peptidase [Deltaproteobacteria bacterium]|jgi:cell wall-associated NlpC family hydrolase|nr:C40 family peptidase [Deltaproteobacteria bacterium]
MKKRLLFLVLSISALGLLLTGCGAKKGSSSGLGMELAKSAHQYIGVPYVYGGRSPKGFDCSGLVWYVYRQHGVELPVSSAKQARVGKKVDKDELVPGDLIFFQNKGRISHVGLYIGGNQMIHAPGRGKKVVKVNIKEKYYRQNYAGARRMI